MTPVQVPSVLIRIPGTARDRILALRRKRKTPWGFSSQEETIGEVVDRITTAAMPKPKEAKDERTHPAVPRSARGRRRVLPRGHRRGSDKGRKVVNNKRGRGRRGKGNR